MESIVIGGGWLIGHMSETLHLSSAIWPFGGDLAFHAWIQAAAKYVMESAGVHSHMITVATGTDAAAFALVKSNLQGAMQL